MTGKNCWTSREKISRYVSKKRPNPFPLRSYYRDSTCAAVLSSHRKKRRQASESRVYGRLCPLLCGPRAPARMIRRPAARLHPGAIAAAGPAARSDVVVGARWVEMENRVVGQADGLTVGESPPVAGLAGSGGFLLAGLSIGSGVEGMSGPVGGTGAGIM